MYQWIESIALSDGVALNLSYHQARLNKTLIHFKSQCSIDIAQELLLLDLPQFGYFKIRIVYGLFGVLDITWSSYTPHIWNQFQLVEANELVYDYKYTDRSIFDELKQKYCSSEIIIVKDGLLTDTSYSNLVFHRRGEWFTPSSYLLAGTQRAFLLDQRKIKEAEISLANLASFDTFKMINAMMSLNNSRTYFTNQIEPL